MSVERMKYLKSLLDEEPRNSFARYALGMELSSDGQTDAALEQFQTLREMDPNYVNAFFMGAQLLQQVGKLQEAAAWLRDGIACAERAGNRHAGSEMQALLDEIEG